MIEFFVSGQSLKFYTPLIAADSLNYLSARLSFVDGQWDGYSKWLHFRREGELGGETYDVQLDEKNEITADKKLNLTVGQWEVYLTGTKEESRLTTVPVILTVKESGLIDAPLHELPLSVAEQVDYTARQALSYAKAMSDAAAAGEFNGKDGKDGTSFVPLGYFETAQELEAAVLQPAPGDVYGVGSKAPYNLYVWDGENGRWLDNGSIQGPAGSDGKDGKNGAVFIPSVDANGNISWLNDGGLENPPTRNIRGPAGKDGNTGPAGPGAFEKAQQAGYTGTEDTFYAALSYMPYHNARHVAGGADPIVMQSGNYGDGTVTAAKLATNAKSKAVAVTLSSGSWSSKTQTVSVSGVTASNNVLVAAAPASRTAWNDAEIYCSAQAEGKLSFKCATVPTANVTANVVILV